MEEGSKTVLPLWSRDEAGAFAAFTHDRLSAGSLGVGKRQACSHSSLPWISSSGDSWLWDYVALWMATTSTTHPRVPVYAFRFQLRCAQGFQIRVMDVSLSFLSPLLHSSLLLNCHPVDLKVQQQKQTDKKPGIRVFNQYPYDLAFLLLWLSPNWSYHHHYYHHHHHHHQK